MNRVRLVLGLLAVAGIGAGVLYESIPKTYIDFDNNGIVDLTVFIDSKQIAMVAANKDIRLSGFKEGTHTFLVKDKNGVVLDEAAYAVKQAKGLFSRTCHIYNMSNTAEYAKVTIVYTKKGYDKPVPKPFPALVRLPGQEKKFFNVTDNDCTLTRHFPKESSLDSGTNYKFVTGICHMNGSKPACD